MAKKPADRYRSAKAFADALTEYLKSGDQPGPTSASATPTFSELAPTGTGAHSPYEPAAETVAEKAAAKVTTPAFQIVPPTSKAKSKVAELVEVEDEDEVEDANETPACCDARRPAKKKRKARSGKSARSSSTIRWCGSRSRCFSSAGSRSV